MSPTSCLATQVAFRDLTGHGPATLAVLKRMGRAASSLPEFRRQARQSSLSPSTSYGCVRCAPPGLVRVTLIILWRRSAVTSTLRCTPGQHGFPIISSRSGSSATLLTPGTSPLRWWTGSSPRACSASQNKQRSDGTAATGCLNREAAVRGAGACLFHILSGDARITATPCVLLPYSASA